MDMANQPSENACGNVKAVALLVARRQEEYTRIMNSPIPENPFGVKSAMWEELLKDRENFPGVNDLLLFRSGYRDHIYGLGLNKKFSDDERRIQRQALLHLVETFSVPEAFIRGVDEPMLGAPDVVEMFGNHLSPLFVRHACEVHQIIRFLKQYNPPAGPIRVCEIGSGFGATAHLLLQNLPIAEYTLIDLAENLYLASLFLPLTLPARTHAVFDPAQGSFDSQRRDLNFVLADFTDHVTSKFDLIVNAASLGEMSLPTVTAYMDWLGRALSPKGLFYSFNRANVRGIDGAKTLSDFHLDRFHLHELLPMKQLSLPYNAVGFEAVVTPAANGRPIPKALLDPVGMLLACGFRQPIISLVESLKSAEGDDVVTSGLERLDVFFREEDPERKQEILDREAFGDRRLASMIAALKAMVAFVSEDFNGFMRQTDAIAWNELGPVIECRLRIARALVGHRAGNPQWTDEIQIIGKHVPAFAEFAREQVENDNMGRLMNVLWYGVTPFAKFRPIQVPGILVRVRNRIRRLIRTYA